MIRTSIRVCVFALCSSLLLLAGCSGSRSDTLNTQNIGRADAAAAIADEDAEVDAEAEGDGDGGDAQSADASEDAGEIVEVEVADGGDAPDTTVVVEVALCGNGKLDADEECDQGASNSNTVVGACRLNCRNARCGDGVVDQGEACDEGPNNSDTAAGACRANCQPARCGDGVVDSTEQCDSADARSDTMPGACRLDCRSARCGDGVQDTDEGCDDGNQVESDACRNNCRSARCGDGTVDSGEECDDGNAVNTDACRDTCRRPTCGDRVVDPGEQCDDGNAVNNDGCRACQSGCRTPQECSDGQFCNGAERCVDGQCMAPLRAVEIDDRIACTDDVCDEATDSVRHTPNNGRCSAPGPVCGDVNGAPTGTTSTATCDATRGCIVSNAQTTCPDRANACGRAGSRLVLTTYDPACNANNMSCGPAVGTTEDCGAFAGSCNAGVYTPPGDCDPSDLTCAAGTPQNCSNESWSCGAGSRTATLTSGTCDPARGCGMATGAPESCDDPPDSCSAGVRRTWAPTCTTRSGCGDARPSDEACRDARGPECGAFGPRGLAAVRTYGPACAADGMTCSTTGAPTGTPTVCEPRVASSCSTPAGANIPQQVNYAPLCASGSACSTTGQPSQPIPCTATQGVTCALNSAGVAQRTYRTPSCDPTGSTCVANGRLVTETCPVQSGTFCLTVRDRASLVTLEPACQDATTCAPSGQVDLDNAQPCTSQPRSCANDFTEVRSVGQCVSATACATATQDCRRLPPVCSTDGRSILRATGACSAPTGCATTPVACAPSCGADATGRLMQCPGGCTNGACAACVPCNGRCVNNACIVGAGTVGTIGSVGTILDPAPVGTVVANPLSFQ